MAKKNSLKKALITSALSMVLCSSMFVGTTYAWFTDSVTSGSNIIQTGTLDVDLVGEDGQTKEGKSINFVDKNGNVLTDILWEPGCTYETEPVYVVNNGNLALKYEVTINGIEGDAKLLEAIEWTALTLTDNGEKVPATLNGTLLEKEAKSGAIILRGHMKEEAGNEYQGLQAGGISISVLATQYTHEKDSIDENYDKVASWLGVVPESLEDTTLVITPDEANKTGTITINSPEDLVYLPKLKAEWVSLYSNGQGTSVSNYYEKNGGKGGAYYYSWTWTIELGADLDMNNIPMDPIDTTFWGTVDGNGHTISNVVVKSSASNFAGLFSVTSGLVKDLNVNNVKVSGKDNVGAVVGYCRGSMDNVHVTNATIEGGNYIGTVAGKAEAGIKDSSVTNATVTATGMTVGGLSGYTLGDTTGNTVENVTVIGAYNVGGLLGQAQNETVAGNTLKNVIVISTTEAIEEWGGECRSDKVAAFKYGEVNVSDNDTEENVSTQNWGGEEKPDSLVLTLAATKNQGGTITINDVEAFLYLNNLSDYFKAQAAAIDGYDNYYYHGAWDIELAADIDLHNVPMAPIDISYWGNFDGNGHVISNLNVVSEGFAGLFSTAHGVANLTIENAVVKAGTNAGAVAGYIVGDVTNVTVINADITGAKYAGGIAGSAYGSFTNCSISNSTVTGNRKDAGGIVGFLNETRTLTGNKVENTTVQILDSAETEQNIGAIVGRWNYPQKTGESTLSGNTTDNPTYALVGAVANGTMPTQAD